MRIIPLKNDGFGATRFKDWIWSLHHVMTSWLSTRFVVLGCCFDFAPEWWEVMIMWLPGTRMTVWGAIIYAKFNILNKKFIMFNTKFIILNTEFIILNAKFIMFNTKSVIFNAKSIMFDTIPYWCHVLPLEHRLEPRHEDGGECVEVPPCEGPNRVVGSLAVCDRHRVRPKLDQN